jgi:hypothetical protein
VKAMSEAVTDTTITSSTYTSRSALLRSSKASQRSSIVVRSFV